LLAFLAASVLPLLLVAAVVYHSTTRHTERLVGRRLQENALQAADAIDDFMRNRVADMRRFGESPIFGRDTAEIAAELRLNVEAYPFYSELLYVDEGGTILAASDSAAVGTPLLERHPDLADEVRAALAGPAGLAYIADLMPWRPCSAGIPTRTRACWRLPEVTTTATTTSTAGPSGSWS
jgi:hypothetical protein